MQGCEGKQETWCYPPSHQEGSGPPQHHHLALLQFLELRASSTLKDIRSRVADAVRQAGVSRPALRWFCCTMLILRWWLQLNVPNSGLDPSRLMEAWVRMRALTCFLFDAGGSVSAEVVDFLGRDIMSLHKESCRHCTVTVRSVRRSVHYQTALALFEKRENHAMCGALC